MTEITQKDKEEFIRELIKRHCLDKEELEVNNLHSDYNKGIIVGVNVLRRWKNGQ